MRPLETREDVDERGLAGAIGTDQADDFASPEPEANFAKGEDAAEADCDGTGAECASAVA
jgi:hypothetical protein